MRFMSGRRLSKRVASSATVPAEGFGARVPVLAVPPLRASSRITMSFDLRSIEWIPAFHPRHKLSPNRSEGRVVPVFLVDTKLVSPPYALGTAHTLNIIEPQHVSMFDSILMDGSRTFAVFARDPEDKNQLAAVVSDLVDVDDSVNTTALEGAAVSALKKVAELQEANNEDVRFNRTLLEQLHAGRGIHNGSLWSMVPLWTKFLGVRAVDTVKKIQIEVHGDIVVGPRTLLNSWADGTMTAYAGGKKARMLRRFDDELDPLFKERFMLIQLMLQTDRHAERLQIFIEFIENEAKRIHARAILKAALRSTQDP